MAANKICVVLVATLLLSFLGGIFSFIEPVPVLALFYPSFVLLFQLTLSFNFNHISRKSRFAYYTLATIVISAGMTLGNFDYVEWATIPLSIVVCLVILCINKCWLQLSLFIESLLTNNKSSAHRSKTHQFIATLLLITSYPTMCSTLFILGSFSPLSSLVNISNALWYYPCLAQFASICGIHGISFLHFWLSALLVIYVYSQYIRVDAADNTLLFSISKPIYKQNLLLFGFLMCFVSLYGGFRLNASHFYHINPVEWHDNDWNLRAVCLTENHTINWQSQIVDVDLIVTNEEYTSQNDAEYAELKQYGQAIARKYSHSVIIAIGIYEPDNSMEVWIANKSNDSHLVFSYLKGNPVPFVEDFQRRRQTPPVVDLKPYGFDFRISGLICFDMAYPDWSRLAKQATLILNPSWLWGSFIDQFVNIVSFRAIENGYHVLHCAYDGNTAFINAYGKIEFKHVNNEMTQHLVMTEISGQKKLSTVYSCIGYVVDYIVMTFGMIYILLTIAVQWKPECITRCVVGTHPSKKGIELESNLYANTSAADEQQK